MVEQSHQNTIIKNENTFYGEESPSSRRRKFIQHLRPLNIVDSNIVRARSKTN